MLPKLPALFLFTFALVHGSAIPKRLSDGISQDTNTNGHTVHSAFLEGRAPPAPKPAAPKPAAPKPAAPKPPPTTSQPVKAPEFPKLPVPYLEDAVDLCDLYIECYEDEDESLTDLGARSLSHHPHDSYHHDRDESPSVLAKRADIVPKLPGGPLRLPTLAYPESGALYTGPRANAPKEVYDFKDAKLGTTSIKKFTTLNNKPTAYYASEHIVERQSIGMFMVFATAKDKTLEAFFRNKYVKPTTGTTSIANRPGKPTYTLGTDPPRDSLMRLVFEALGTTPNPNDLVLCEQQINSLKARVWATKEIMATKAYDQIVDYAMEGGIPSSTFLTAIRLVYGVYGYMSDAGVMAHFKNINGNVQKELKNAGLLYNEPKIDLVPIWNDFIKAQVLKADAHGKKWLSDRFPSTKTKIEASRKKYVQMATKLKAAEEGKDAVKHKDAQKKTQTQLEAKVKTAEAAVTAAKKAVEDLKLLRTTGTTAQKKGLTGKIKKAKLTLETKERDLGKAQRAIHELYSYSVNLIVKNLEKDSARVSNFEKGIASLKLTAP